MTPTYILRKMARIAVFVARVAELGDEGLLAEDEVCRALQESCLAASGMLVDVAGTLERMQASNEPPEIAGNPANFPP